MTYNNEISSDEEEPRQSERPPRQRPKQKSRDNPWERQPGDQQRQTDEEDQYVVEDG